MLLAAPLMGATFQTFDDGMGNITWSNDGGLSSCGACTPTKNDDIIVNHEIDLTGAFEIKATLTINSGGKLNIVNGSTGDLEITGTGTLTVNSGGTLEVQRDFDIRNGATVLINTGGVVTVGRNMQNFNNSDDVTINGSLSVTGNLTNGNGGDIDGSGSISVGGTITNNGTIGGSTGNDLGTLPVEVLFFEGSIDDQDHAILEWATTSEENFDFFTVERSTDGLNYDGVGEIKGAGNSTQTLYYTYIDERKVEGSVYYRLKATDIDGFVEYHGIVSLQGKKREGVSVYPNPFNGETITLTNAFSGSGRVMVSILDMTGRTVYTKEVNFGQNTLNFYNKLEKGNYLMMIRNNGKTYKEKLIVQ